MKILVTGATGFVGKSLLPLLSEQGHEIVVLTRDIRSAGVRLPVACRTVQWNPEGGPPPLEALQKVQAVIHLAGESVAGGRWTEQRKQNIRRSRILSTKHLVDAIHSLDEKPEVFVSASAIGIYGDRGEELLTAASSAGDGFLAEVCGQWEAELFRAQGVRTVALRTGIVLGPDGGAMKMMLPAFRMGLGGPLGSGRQWMSWVHVRDLARLFLHAVETPSLKGPINAVAPHPVRNNEFTGTLGRILKRPAFFRVPGLAIRMALGDMSEILLSGQKVASDQTVQSGFKFLYPQLKTALKLVCDTPGHELLTEQWVAKSVGEIFNFFSDAKNLEILTPPWLNFKILKVSTERMQEGTRLDYRLQLHGIPFYWQSLITDWRAGVRFSDRQTRGPYAFWHHTHEFIEKDGGTVIRDRAKYKVPLGVPGDVVLHGFIRRDLEKIFSYRHAKIAELFGG
jgi:uncharacterized protein (TIGR01777 family)